MTCTGWYTFTFADSSGIHKTMQSQWQPIRIQLNPECQPARLTRSEHYSYSCIPDVSRLRFWVEYTIGGHNKSSGFGWLACTVKHMLVLFCSLLFFTSIMKVWGVQVLTLGLRWLAQIMCPCAKMAWCYTGSRRQPATAIEINGSINNCLSPGVADLLARHTMCLMCFCKLFSTQIQRIQILEPWRTTGERFYITYTVPFILNNWFY